MDLGKGTLCDRQVCHKDCPIISLGLEIGWATQSAF